MRNVGLNVLRLCGDVIFIADVTFINPRDPCRRGGLHSLGNKISLNVIAETFACIL